MNGVDNTDEANPEQAEGVRGTPSSVISVLTGLMFGGLFLILLEFGWTAVIGRFDVIELPATSYAAALVVMTLGLWLVHALPVWALVRATSRWVGRRRWWLVGFAAVFGLSWQQTVVQGDGISAHPLFTYIRIGFLVGVPLVCAGLVWLFLTRRIPRGVRIAAASLFLVGGVVFNMTVLTGYQAFHGHLAVFNAAVLVGLLWPLWKHPAARSAAAVIALIFAVAAAVVLPGQEDARTNVQRFAHLPASLSAGSPIGDVVRVEPDKIFTVEKASYDELEEYYELFFEDESKFQTGPRLGDNVLFVVLESVRADYWDDPELTPEFHDWKHEGVYLPYSVANYPATPLAYGAMFAAQPPSVLAQTPYWGDNRLFDEIKGDFDQLYFSQPDISWFEHTAITDFFLPRDESVNAHEEGPDGLEYLRDNLGELGDEETFFSWVHLYEPHDPYEPREPWVDGATDDHSAYRSEISYIDHHLGEFMNWFFDQPFADDTLVVVISDHGQGMGEEIMGESFWGHHEHVHNVVTDIPMFVAGPELPADERHEELPGMQLDVMPTIYQFLGRAMPRELMPQGNSVHRLLDDRPDRPLVTEAFSIRGHQFFEFVADTQQGRDLEELRREFHEISTDSHGYSPKISIQHGNYKLIHDRLLETNRLYNIADDPREEYDLYDERPDKAETMVDRLDQWNTLQGEVVRRLDEVLE